jgi:hypothetical protein
MDKKIAGLLGAAAALTTVTAANAAVAAGKAEAAPAGSYSDLLKPVPNALAALRADDAARLQQAPARVQLAQYHHHHHHHHHHGYNPGAAIIGGVIGGIIGSQAYGPPPPPPPPCYWTLGQPYWNGYAWVRPRVQVCQ